MSVTILFLGPLGDLAGEAQREVNAPLDWTGLLEAVGPDIAERMAEVLRDAGREPTVLHRTLRRAANAATDSNTDTDTELGDMLE